MANDIERPYPLIRGELEAGRVVPFLGSGASRLQGSGDGLPVLPSAGELSLLLAKATSFPSDDPRDRGDLATVVRGVRFQQTPVGEGIRFGTSMTRFPNTYGTHRPENKKSKIGRMFDIDVPQKDGAPRLSNLESFLAALLRQSLSTSVPISTALPDVDAKVDSSPDSAPALKR